MDKTIVRLTESELKQIIHESIEKVLADKSRLVHDIDIKKIPIEILRQAYVDYRLLPNSVYYGNKFHEPAAIKEAIGDIIPPDDLLKEIYRKYSLPQGFARKEEHFHRIYVYIIVALVGKNVELIKDDMERAGYFLSVMGDVTEVEGMSFQLMQFEPTSQLQEDITDLVKSRYDVLYHWTPSYCVDGIMQDGLIPSNRSSIFKYSPRTYLMEGDSTDEQMIYLGRLLCARNASQENNGEYALLAVNLEGLDESIRFYYDPNSEIGVYTEQTIPSDKIELQDIIQLRMPIERNEQPNQ